MICVNLKLRENYAEKMEKMENDMAAMKQENFDMCKAHAEQMEKMENDMAAIKHENDDLRAKVSSMPAHLNDVHILQVKTGEKLAAVQKELAAVKKENRELKAKLAARYALDICTQISRKSTVLARHMGNKLLHRYQV